MQYARAVQRREEEKTEEAPASRLAREGLRVSAAAGQEGALPILVVARQKKTVFSLLARRQLPLSSPPSCLEVVVVVAVVVVVVVVVVVASCSHRLTTQTMDAH